MDSDFSKEIISIIDKIYDFIEKSKNIYLIEKLNVRKK